MTTFAIANCRIGNLRSVQKIFERLGASAPIAESVDELLAADAIVLPGVGAFGDAMKRLESDGLSQVIREEVAERGKPVLGICLGMQLLARGSAEEPGMPGLGIVPADVVPFNVKSKRDWMGRKLTLPHIGWNEVERQADTVLFDGIESGTDFYFVHGFHLVPDELAWAAGTTVYGDTFVCALEHGNVYATQFHPEKSQKQGQRVIGNFVSHVSNISAR